MTEQTTAELVGEWAAKKAEADALYAEVKELEFDIITNLRRDYPDEWKRWERGVESFKAEGVTVALSRSYDADKLRAEFGEERPDIFETKTIPEHTETKIVGRLLTGMWKDAGLARRLEKCVLPPGKPKVKVG